MKKIESLKKEFELDKMLNHNFYKHYWVEGKLNRDILAEYAKQYYFIEKTFINALNILLSKTEKIEDEDFNKIVLENLKEELGQVGNIPHLELLSLFAAEFGISKEDINAVDLNLETQILINNFIILAQDSIPSAIGAMYAYEFQIPDIAKTKIEGLKKFYGVEKQSSLAFFKTHMIADVWHTEQWQKLINKFSEEDFIKFRNSFSISMKSLSFFLDGMMRTSKLSFNC